MTTRSQKIKDIEKVAQGRIFLATEAKDLGLIDEIGGTEAAISCAADRAGLSDGHYEVRVCHRRARWRICSAVAGRMRRPRSSHR